MKFINFVKNDMVNGIILEWSKYIITAILFFILSLLHFLDIQIVNLSNPEYLEKPPTIGDYLLGILAGKKRFLPDESMESFAIPILWIAIIIWALFITLYYPYKDIMGVGKHLIILSGSRDSWWFSKCLWAFLSMVAYAFTAGITVVVSALCFGAEPSLRISEYLPKWLNFELAILKPPPWEIGGVIIMFLLVTTAISMLQLVLSLVLKPVFSYITVVVYVLASSYYFHPMLIGNFAMAARNDEFVSGGLIFLDAVVICGGIIAICIVFGSMYFKSMDIIGRD